MKTHTKTLLAAFTAAALLAGTSAHAATITEDFEGSSGTTTPTGWALIDSSGTGSGTYNTSTGFAGAGQGGLLDWTGSSNNPVKTYIVNTGDAFDLTNSVSGSFDFYVTEDGNYSGINFILGNVQGGLTTNAGEFLDMHLREKTFGARAFLQDGDGSVVANPGTNDQEVFTNAWYSASFTWTPTSGTTGDFYIEWGTTTPTESLSATGYTFNSANGYFGFGTGKSPGTYDNINISGTLIPEPGSLALLGLGGLLIGARRRRS